MFFDGLPNKLTNYPWPLPPKSPPDGDSIFFGPYSCFFLEGYSAGWALLPNMLTPNKPPSCLPELEPNKLPPCPPPKLSRGALGLYLAWGAASSLDFSEISDFFYNAGLGLLSFLASWLENIEGWLPPVIPENRPPGEGDELGAGLIPWKREGGAELPPKRPPVAGLFPNRLGCLLLLSPNIEDPPKREGLFCYLLLSSPLLGSWLNIVNSQLITTIIESKQISATVHFFMSPCQPFRSTFSL